MTSYDPTHFPLSVAVLTGDVLSLRLGWDSSRFGEAEVQRLGRGFSRLMESLLADGDGLVGDLPELFPAERLQVLAPAPAPRRKGAPAPLVVPKPAGEALGDDSPCHLFAAQATLRPTALAVVHGPVRWTYGELDRLANQMARHLLDRGVGPEVRVGLLLPRSTDALVTLLGVLKAGGTFVPLDPELPAERIRFMVRDTGCQAVVSTAGLPVASALEEVRHRILLDTDGEEIRSHSEAPPPPRLVSSRQGAYVLFTSGSTGRPKGALISHGALAGQIRWLVETFQLGPRDRQLFKTPMAFDASVWEWAAPLAAGSTVVVADPEDHRDPAALLRRVEEHGVTLLQVTPTVLRALLEEERPAALASLRHLFSGGEALGEDLRDRVGEELGIP